jgi:hypothetical protein
VKLDFKNRNCIIPLPSVPGTGAFLPSGSGILDSEGMFLGEIFLNYLKNPCSLIISLKRLAPETIRSKKKVGFIFPLSF